VNSTHKRVSAAISTLLRPVKGFVYSITYDNGKEFSGHEQVNKNPRLNFLRFLEKFNSSFGAIINGEFDS
jgi:IS30 family transposase